MTEFKQSVPHTGGVLTIRKQGTRYQLSYHHINPHAAGLVQLVAAGGKPVGSFPISGVDLSGDDPAEREILTVLPTDSEGMYGRRCPTCTSYFRTSHPFTEVCPYCPAR